MWLSRCCLLHEIFPSALSLSTSLIQTTTSQPPHPRLLIQVPTYHWSRYIALTRHSLHRHSNLTVTTRQDATPCLTAEGTEALKAAAGTATDIATGTMTTADATMAIAITIPMGKPNGVAAHAACVKSKHFYCHLTVFISWHQLTSSTDTATPTDTHTAQTGIQTEDMEEEEATAAPTATEVEVEVTRCRTSARI